MNRRTFLTALLAHVVAARHLLAASAPKKLGHWIRAHDDLAHQLHAGKFDGTGWMREVEALSASMELDELLRGIDFAKIEREFRFTNDGGTKQMLRLPHPDDPTKGMLFGAAIFGLERNKAITPHGHRFMTSAHLVLKGELRVRNFDRVADEEQHLILRPTVDDIIRPGACSTMSTERNNIHWFVARTPAAFTLDAVVSDLVPGQPSFKIDLVDPRGGTKLADGTIRAPRIDWKTSVRLYGEETRR
jgi:PCO_ADO